jgi:hypothetical protein
VTQDLPDLLARQASPALQGPQASQALQELLALLACRDS